MKTWFNRKETRLKFLMVSQDTHTHVPKYSYNGNYRRFHGDVKKTVIPIRETNSFIMDDKFKDVQQESRDSKTQTSETLIHE